MAAPQTRLPQKTTVVDISAAPQWMKDALQACTPQMQVIEQRYMAPDAPVQLLKDEAKKTLRSVKLMTREKKLSWRMGVHPDNRYGDGVVPSDVIGLISDIFGHGASKSALQDPTACEMPPPGHPRAEEFLKFNNAVIAGSGGQLPEYEGELIGVTVTCGHTSMGNRCWQAGSPSDDERFTLDGRLSLERLREIQPSYAEMVDDGIEYDFIRWPVEIVFPFIPKLFQEAGNAGQQIARCESRLEVMLKIREVAARNAKLNNGDPKWDRVEREAKRGGSPFLPEMPHLVSFVKNLAGGLNDPFLLYELRDFSRQLQTQRVVKGQTLATIAEVELGAQAAAPRFRLAAVKAMVAASAKFAKGNEQNLFKSSEFLAMKSIEKRKLVLEAEKFLVQARDVAEQHGLKGPMLTSLIGLLDVRVVHFVTSKPDESRGHYKSFNDIGFSFCSDMAAALKTHVASPWAQSAEQAEAERTAKAPSAKAHSEVKEFSNKGSWINSLEVVTAKGIKIDVTVAHYKSHEVFRVKANVQVYVYVNIWL